MFTFNRRQSADISIGDKIQADIDIDCKIDNGPLAAKLFYQNPCGI